MGAMDPELRLRPVVAFDVDGVLRVGRAPDSGEGLIRREITLEQAQFPELFHGKPRWPESGRITIPNHFSQAGVELLKTIAGDSVPADAVWATTWQRWANYYFGPALELPELPVAVETLEPMELNWAHCSPDWKSAQLSRQFDGRPLIWLDDNLPDRPSEDLTERRRPIDRALTLSYRVSPWTGLTSQDSEFVLSWLERASTPEGQRELREERAAQLRARRLEIARDRRRWDREHEIFLQIQAKVEEILPGNERLARELGSMAGKRTGLTAENVSYALLRHGLDVDAEELSARLRIPRYHYRVDSDRHFGDDALGDRDF